MAKTATATKAKAEVATKKAPKEKVVKDKAPRVTIGSVAEKAILAGKNNDEVIAAIQEQFPDANTSPAAANWYRTKLRKAGHKVKSTRVVKEAAPKPTKAKGKPGRPVGKGKAKAKPEADDEDFE